MNSFKTIAVAASVFGVVFSAFGNPRTNGGNWHVNTGWQPNGPLLSTNWVFRVTTGTSTLNADLAADSITVRLNAGGTYVLASDAAGPYEFWSVTFNQTGLGGVTNAITVIGTGAVFRVGDTAGSRGRASVILGGATTDVSILVGDGNTLWLSDGAASSEGRLEGAGKNLALNGTGTYTFDTANAYGGVGNTVTLNGGTLNINHANALGNANNTFILNGGTIDNNSTGAVTVAGNPQTWNTDVVFTGTRSLNMGAGRVTMTTDLSVDVQANALTIGGNITNDNLYLHEFTKTGNGTLILDGPNTYRSKLFIEQGTLSVTNANNQNTTGPLGNSTNVITMGGAGLFGTLMLTGTTASATDRLFTMASSGGGGGRFNVTNGANTLTLNNTVSGGGQMDKLGPGTLLIRGTNTFTGRMTISIGTAAVEVVNNASANGPLGNSAEAVRMGATIGSSIATLKYLGGTASSTKPFDLFGLRGIFEVTNASSALTLSGTITNRGELTKTGPGTLVLAGNNTFTNLITASAGTLRAGVASVEGVSGPFGLNARLYAATTVDLNGYDVTIGSLDGNGSGNVLIGGNTLTVGTDDRDSNDYNGFITGTGGNVVKVGSGLAAFTGNNRVSLGGGSLIVSNGTMSINVNQTALPIIVAGGTLSGTGSVSTITLSGGNLSPDGTGPIGNRRLTGPLTLNSGRLTIEMTNAAGVQGVDWDILNVNSGAGTVAMGSGVVTISLTYASANLPGFSGFDSESWLIVNAGTVSGFSASKFAVRTNDFVPNTYEGTFSVSESSGDIFLNFTPAPAIDLVLQSVTASSPTVNVASAYSYTITVSNAGPVAAQTYHITNVLPSTATYVSSTDGGSHNAGTVRWVLSNLAAGATKTVTLNVTAPLGQSIVTNRVAIAPNRAEIDTGNNSGEVVTQIICPGAPAPFIQRYTHRVGTNGQLMTFSVISTNVDCSTPFLYASIPGGTFTVVTNDADHMVTGTFSWTPPAVGTYQIRIYSYNIGSTTSSYSMPLYIGTIGEPQDGSGVPTSQTNWLVEITNISAVSSGNATLVWEAVNGISYDIYTTAENFGLPGVLWNHVASSVANASMASQLVTASGSQRYYKVVPEGQPITSNGVWAIIKPSIAPGFNSLSVPVELTNRSFNGSFGAALAAPLTGNNIHGLGDEVFILNANGTYSNLYLDASKVWRTTQPGNPVSTYELSPGQGFIVLNRTLSTVQPEFRGPVGNRSVSTNTIPAGGYTIIGLSEGKYLNISSAFSDIVSGSGPAGSFDETQADTIIIMQSNGSYIPLQRLPNGTWLDLTTFSTATQRFTPGVAYWYVRTPTGNTFRVRF